MLDMRWKDLKSQHKFQSKFNRKIQASDIINPDEARDMCENVGLPYYECTVLTGYGVSDVFENAIRAALIHKRSARFETRSGVFLLQNLYVLVAFWRVKILCL